MSRCRIALAAVVLIVTACSGADEAEVTGVVTDVVGDITAVEVFTLRLPDGTDRTFEPAPGILFHDSAPLGHLRDHLRSGEPVRVRYRVLDDGSLEALEVGD